MREVAAPKTSVLATYRLPFAIAFDQSCSGIEGRSRIGSVDVVVVLPRLVWTDDGPRIEGPLAGTAFDLAPTWGEPAGWDPNPKIVDAWWARGLVLVVDVGELSVDAAAEGLVAALSTWTERLAGWIEAIVGQDAGRAGPLRNLSVDGERLAVWVDGTVYREAPDVFGMTVLPPAAATLESEVWRTILREVGEGSDVPQEHLLLSDARAWLRREDYRRAIIDAAAAAELVLTEILDWKFAAAPPAVENQFPLERRTLGPLADLLAPLVPVSKDRLDRLVLTRNSAMHKSHVATPSDAAEAVAVAEELVALIYPIDALLGR